MEVLFPDRRWRYGDQRYHSQYSLLIFLMNKVHTFQSNYIKSLSLCKAICRCCVFVRRYSGFTHWSWCHCINGSSRLSGAQCFHTVLSHSDLCVNLLYCGETFQPHCSAMDYHRTRCGYAQGPMEENIFTVKNKKEIVILHLFKLLRTSPGNLGDVPVASIYCTNLKSIEFTKTLTCLDQKLLICSMCHPPFLLYEVQRQNYVTET